MTIRTKDLFRAQAAERERARRNAVHTLVAHTDPDLEICLMYYLITVIAGVRERLCIAKNPGIKFIHSGPLCAEDWRDLGLDGGENLTAAEIEKRGYLFLDCGGGRFDSHGKETTKSSLDLLVEVCRKEIEDEKPWLLLPIAIVSMNDRTGADVAPDDDEHEETPHTRRHLRKLVDGLNLRHPNQPEMVLAYMNFAFYAVDLLAADAKMTALGLGSYHPGIATWTQDKKGKIYDHKEEIRPADLGMRSLLEYVDRALDGSPTSTITLEKCLKDAGSVFLVDLIIDEMRGWPVHTDCLVEEYERALEAVELEWTRAETDFDDPEKTTVRRIKGCFPLRNREVGEITLVVGLSDSPRYGEVARHNAKAEVVIQINSDGRFLVYSKSLHLGGVAAAIRGADLTRKGVAPKLIENAPLAKVGHLRITNGSGQSVETIYFAEYGKACGNAFRSNPCSPECALNTEELEKAVIDCLAGAPASKEGRADDRRRDHRGGSRRGGHRG